MKNIFFALPLAALLVSCDPAIDEIEPSHNNITTQQLTEAVICTQKTKGNNNMVFSTKDPVRAIRVYDASNGLELAAGLQASYRDFGPARTLEYYVETYNADGTVTKSDNLTVDIDNFTDIPQIYDDIFGEGYASKKLVWNADAPDGVWGNGGYMGNVMPGWWKVYINDITQQATEKGLPDDGADGWMILAPSTLEKKSGAVGKVFITDKVLKEGWDIGQIDFEGVFPLMGINVNNGNTPFYQYSILKASDGEFNICAPEPGAGEWGTAWFWCFKEVAK